MSAGCTELADPSEIVRTFDFVQPVTDAGSDGPLDASMLDTADVYPLGGGIELAGTPLKRCRGLSVRP